MIYNLTKPSILVKHFSNKFITDQYLLDDIFVNLDNMFELNIGQLYSKWFNYSDTGNYIIKNGSINGNSKITDTNNEYQDFYFSKNQVDSYGNKGTTTYYIVGEFLDNLESRVLYNESLLGKYINLLNGVDEPERDVVFVETHTAGEDILEGQICYYDGDGKMYVASSSIYGSRGLIRMALEDISSGIEGSFSKYGLTELDASTTGAIQYLGTDGNITEVVPDTSGYIVRTVGYCVNGKFLLDIDTTFIEVV